MTNTFLTSRTRYQVVAPAVVVPVVGRFGVPEIYAYKNAVLPADADPSSVEHLLAEGLIAPLGGAA